MAGTVTARVKTSDEGSSSAQAVSGMPFAFALSRRKSAMASIDRMRPPETSPSGVSTVTAFFSSRPAKQTSLTLSSAISMPTIFFTCCPRFLS